MKYYWLVLLLVILSTPYIHSQELITDRPDQTESSSIVPQYHLQWEAGTLYEVSRSSQDWTVFTNLFRYGVSNKLELRLVTEFINTKSRLADRGLNGISDIQLGLKYNFVSNDAVSIAYMGHIILPNGSDNVSIGNVGTVNRINIDHNLGEHFSSGINLGYEYYDSSNGNFVYTWAVGASLTEKLGFYGEVFGDWEEFESWTSNIDFGFTYLLKPQLQLDFSIGTGLTEKYNYYSMGFSWRIPY